MQSKVVLAGALLVLFSALASVLRYLAFRYRVDDDGIRIRDGVLRRKETRIRLDRIQGISTEQNFVYRVLGLVTLSFDTAGSGSSEGVLPAVALAEAESLGNMIDATPTPREANDEQRQDAAVQHLLMKLGWRDNVRIGLADGRALVLLAFLGPLLERAGDRAEILIANSIEDAAGTLERLGTAAGAAIVAGLLFAVLVVFALLSILAAFLRYHDFRLYHSGERLRSTGGLLTRQENVMRIAKVQILSVRQSVMLRLFGRLRIVLKQARSASRDRSSKHFVVPLATPAFADEFASLVFAPEASGIDADPWRPDFARVSTYYLRARLFLTAVVSAAAGVLLLVLQAGTAGAWALLLVPAGSLLAYQSWRRLAFRFDRDAIVRRSGLLGVQLDTILYRKVQRVSIRQSWFQRRRKLADLKLYTASGPISIPYLGEELARQLRDYTLYRVQTSRKAWL
jgi:putative membrane protein